MPGVHACARLLPGGRRRAALGMHSCALSTAASNHSAAPSVPLPSTPVLLQFHYSVSTATVMTAIMAAALLFFTVAQNRWSWHLVGPREEERLEEALPQPPPAGLPWDWHCRPLGGHRRTESGLAGKRSGAAEALPNGSAGEEMATA